MDIGRLIRKHVRDLLENADVVAPTNVAAATNIGTSGHTTSVYSDERVTIVQYDGKTEVIRHHRDEPGESEAGEPGD